MKIIVQFSGGKDSAATLAWAVQKYGSGKVMAVFCDTGHEHEWTYHYIDQVCDMLGVECRYLVPNCKSFSNIAHMKGRFPSTKARFCTQHLKVYPFTDFLLDEVQDNVLILQGIRASESKARSKMNKYCAYFNRWRTSWDGNRERYRRKEVLEWITKYDDSILRPIIDWSADDVFKYIDSKKLPINPLYQLGFGRVGCFPCIMSKHRDVRLIMKNSPETINWLREMEIVIESTFFPPGFIPERFCSKWVEVLKEIHDPNDKSKDPEVIGYTPIMKRVPTIDDVVKYLKMKSGEDQPSLFTEEQATAGCLSEYRFICE